MCDAAEKGHHALKTRFLQPSGWHETKQETGFFQWTICSPKIVKMILCKMNHAAIVPGFTGHG